MPRGPRPKPTHLRIIGGNASRRPLPEGEPKPMRGVPDSPDHLSERISATWNRYSIILGRMGVLTEADGDALERMSELYVEIVDLTRNIAERGHVYQTITETGSIIYRPRPECAMLADCDRRFRAYLIEFGLTPAARAKVKASGQTEEDAAASYFGT